MSIGSVINQAFSSAQQIGVASNVQHIRRAENTGNSDGTIIKGTETSTSVLAILSDGEVNRSEATRTIIVRVSQIPNGLRLQDCFLIASIEWNIVSYETVYAGLGYQILLGKV